MTLQPSRACAATDPTRRGRRAPPSGGGVCATTQIGVAEPSVRGRSDKPIPLPAPASTARPARSGWRHRLERHQTLHLHHHGREPNDLNGRDDFSALLRSHTPACSPPAGAPWECEGAAPLPTNASRGCCTAASETRSRPKRAAVSQIVRIRTFRSHVGTANT